ncbi:hypothetical protein M434DRAFT_399341 [Hypoxylon sp. CO27-5]|nr:hypothetical protein M434DRAFT_399341 [Hypoxylon sp. CO27-5]
MPTQGQVVRHEGLPIGLIKINSFYSEFDFKQAFEFIKKTIKKKLGKEMEQESFNGMLLHAALASTPEGRRGRYSICWMAAKFLDELWHLIFTTQSPWFEFVFYQLKTKQLNNRDDWMVYGSYLTDGLLDSNIEKIIREFFDPKFPMSCN